MPKTDAHPVITISPFYKKERWEKAIPSLPLIEPTFGQLASGRGASEVGDLTNMAHEKTYMLR